MATIANLEAAYTAITRLTPSTAQSLILQDLATRTQAGLITDAQAYAYIIGQAQGTTTVANLTYQFFTGKTPTAAGLNFLVNSTTNTSDLNDAYYQNFNLENRYINFAVNLGVSGEGRANFVATFGGLSFADTVAVAYNRIIGNAQAAEADIDVNAAVADIAGRKAYFDAVAAQAGVAAGDLDLAAKAAVVGYIMAEAVKAQVGVYSNGVNNFYLDLAPDGKASFNVDLNTVYVNNAGGEGGAGTPGNTIVVAADQSVEQGDAATDATINNDKITGAIDAATDDVVIDLGNGADTIGSSATPVTLTSATGKTVDISLGGGNDTAFLKLTEVDEGITIDGGAGTDALTLVLASNVADTVVSGFETVTLTNTGAAADYTVDSTLFEDVTAWTVNSVVAGKSITLDDIDEDAVVTVSGTGTTVLNYDDASDVTIKLGGGGSEIDVNGVEDEVNLVVTKQLSIDGVDVDASTLTVTGGFSVALGTVVVAGKARVVDLGALTKDASLTYATGGATSDTITLGAGDDALTLNANSHKAVSIELGEGADNVTILATSTGALNVDYTTGGALKTVTEIVDFDVTEDSVTLGGTAAYVAVTAGLFTGAPGATDQARIAAVQTTLGVDANEFTIFDAADGSGAYIYYGGDTAGAADDVIIKLTGISAADLEVDGRIVAGA